MYVDVVGADGIGFRIDGIGVSGSEYGPGLGSKFGQVASKE